MKYQPPFGSVDPNASFVNGNPSTGTLGSIPPAAAIEEPQREIVNAIIAAGLVPSDNFLTQLTSAIELLGRVPFCSDQGVANALVINPNPPVAAYGGTESKIYAVQVAYTNGSGGCTVNVSGLGAVPLVRPTGADLSANDLTTGGIALIAEVAGGSPTFQLVSAPGSLAFPLPQQLWHYGVDTGSVNAIVATIDPVGTSLPLGIPIAILVGHTNTSGTVTVTVNGLPATGLKRGSGGALSNGDVAAGYIALMMFDGTELQLINILNGSAGGAGGNDITGPDRPYWISVNSATTTAPPGSPSLGDTYLIPSSGATGAWASLPGRLAQWNGASWVYRSYPAGSFVCAADTLQVYECIAPTTWIFVLIPSRGALFFYGQL